MEQLKKEQRQNGDKDIKCLSLYPSVYGDYFLINKKDD